MTKVDPYLHAVLVLHGTGKEVSQDGIVAVVKAAGGEPDEAKAKVLSDAVKDVDFEELLENVATVAAAPAAAPAAPAEGGDAKEEKKEEEEPTEEKKEEQAAEGLANLFG